MSSSLRLAREFCGLGVSFLLATAAIKRAVWTIFCLRTRFIDGQIATIYLMAFQCSNGRLAFVPISHGDKCEPARLATHAISHEMNICDSAMGRKQLAQFGFTGRERKITNVQFHIQLRR
jgi:hypothetical protein